MKRCLAITGLVMLLAAQSDLSRAQWVQCNGPYGGDISAFTTMGSIIFAGTNRSPLPGRGGMFCSEDTAKSWHSVNSGLISTNIWALTVADTILFASTDSGVFASRDSGQTWFKANTGLGFSIPYHFASLGKSIFAGTIEDGLFESTNFGSTWANIDSVFPPHTSAGTPIASGTNLFAETGNGLYRSTDSGASWFAVTAGLPNDSLGPPLIAMGTTLFASGGGYGGHVNVYRSTDYGSTWTITGLTNADVGYFAVIGTTLLAAGYDVDTLYRSTDSGATWSTRNDGFGSLQALAVFGNELLAGNDEEGTNPGGSGVYLSSDSGDTWSFASTGIINSPILTLASVGQNLFASTTSSDVWLSTDDGSSWSSSSSSVGNDEIGSLYAFGTYLFAGISDDSIYVSRDSGKTFYNASNGITGQGVANISPVFGSFGTNCFAGDYYGIYRSTDSAKDWTSIASGLPKDPDVSSIIVFGNYLFATSYDGTGVIRSTDTGASWQPCNNGLPNLFVLGLATSGSNLYVTTINKGIFRSTDSGASWITVYQGLPDYNVGDFAVSGSNVFILSDSGIYLTTDNGGVWEPVNWGLGEDSTSVSSIAICSGYAFVGTLYAGVYRRPLSDFGISGVTQPPASPPQIQSYPNPFSSQATITFTNPNEGYAEVTIVNLLGAEVTRLFTGELAAGEHSFVWDMPPGLPDGMYECVVNMGGQTQRISLVHLQ